MPFDFDLIVALFARVFVHAHSIGQLARQVPTGNCGCGGKKTVVYVGGFAKLWEQLP